MEECVGPDVCQVDFHFNHMLISILIIGCCHTVILCLNSVAREESLACLVLGGSTVEIQELK